MLTCRRLVVVDGLDPRTIQVFNQSDEIAVYVEGETDAVFDPGDYLLFYGQKLNTKYTDTNVYWLTWGEFNGRRMSEMDGTPSGTANVPLSFYTTKHVEINTKYRASERNGPDNDHWYWDKIIAFSGPSSKNFTTNLQHLSPRKPAHFYPADCSKVTPATPITTPASISITI